MRDAHDFQRIPQLITSAELLDLMTAFQITCQLEPYGDGRFKLYVLQHDVERVARAVASKRARVTQTALV